MDYQEAIQYIHLTPKFSRESGNKLFLKLLQVCGHPEKELNCIHIAGTNGKGSTAIMLSEILQESGYKTGLYTSPYIERYNERIQINGTPIPDEALAEIITELKTIIERYHTPIPEFALGTAAAFCWFARRKVDVVVLETGLGGRLDATNVIEKNLVSVITAIGLDHTQYLGDTVTKIAAEKCGIIKKDCPTVSYPLQNNEVWDVIKEFTSNLNSELEIAEIPELQPEGMRLNGKDYLLGLKGNFQIYNAATVVKTIEVLKKQGLKIPDSAVDVGLRRAKNPARYEQFGQNVFLDGAHNPQAIRALWETLEQTKQPVYLCTAMMEDKDYLDCVSFLAKRVKGVVTTTLSMPRCCPAEVLAKAYQESGAEEVYVKNCPQEALEKALELANRGGIVCICGSLYLAGEVRPYLRKLVTEKG